MAVRLGVWNPEVIARGLTAKQFVEWECYARLEPFNELRADYRAASIAQMIFNMAVNVKDRKKINEFLLQYGEPEPQPKQDTLGLLKIMAAAYSTDVNPVPPINADLEESARMREQVRKAHAAMKGMAT